MLLVTHTYIHTYTYMYIYITYVYTHIYTCVVFHFTLFSLIYSAVFVSRRTVDYSLVSCLRIYIYITIRIVYIYIYIYITIRIVLLLLSLFITIFFIFYTRQLGSLRIILKKYRDKKKFVLGWFHIGLSKALFLFLC